jgi:hypothetical protein
MLVSQATLKHITPMSPKPLLHAWSPVVSVHTTEQALTVIMPHCLLPAGVWPCPGEPGVCQAVQPGGLEPHQGCFTGDRQPGRDTGGSDYGNACGGKMYIQCSSCSANPFQSQFFLRSLAMFSRVWPGVCKKNPPTCLDLTPPLLCRPPPPISPPPSPHPPAGQPACQ